MFYPLIKVLGLTGWVDLFNFPPNDWQGRGRSTVVISVFYPDANGDDWVSVTLQHLRPGEVTRIKTDDLPDEALSRGAAFLFASRQQPPSAMSELPTERAWNSDTPAWRATVGMQGHSSRVSYQGEIEPFPLNGSLISFHPFLQFVGVDNYLLTVNLQSLPIRSSANIEIYRASTRDLIDVQPVLRNGASIIPLDGYGFTANDLPVFVCREISVIPFGLGLSQNGEVLSLEHTHPPASFFIHGERWKQQSVVKGKWFELLGGGNGR